MPTNLAERVSHNEVGVNAVLKKGNGKRETVPQKMRTIDMRRIPTGGSHFLHER